ncbi:EamA family transporter RarD [Sphingobium sp.]|uniref:EamA family transporter RarD n=1 Tax=Sphingobium sp. TaxID=1912891 RepID=UPI0035C6FCE1
MRGGLLAAAGAYGAWGLLPIFFRLLHHVGAVEIVAQRILWSLLLILALLAAQRRLAALSGPMRDRRLLLPLIVSALLIGANWLIYVWGVNNGHVVAASLGYFLNPLISVGLGVLILKEKLRRGQAVAIGLAALGVAIMAASALTTLWISFGLALSFAFYGLVRKLTPVAPMSGLGVETVLLAPFALGFLVFQGHTALGQDIGTTLLLVVSGAVTTVPLVLFATAAHRLPMAMLGLLQYLAPTLQFLCGVLLFGEKLTTGQMASFALIWLGLALFAADSISAARRNRMAMA